MFAKLAIRNAKRQFGNYLIYFITVALTVALMFAINNLIFSAELTVYANKSTDLRNAMVGITVIVALIVAFVLGYATSFMLKLRKREFGAYLTLGMTRKNLLSIFILETLIYCFIALGLGILLGLLIYQGLMMVLSNLLEIPFAFSPYSLKGLLLTVIIVCGIFVLSSLTSAVYLKKVSISQLIQGETVDKTQKHPILWFVVTLISLTVLIFSVVMAYADVKSLLNTGEEKFSLFADIALLAISIILFHIGMSKSAINMLLKNKKFCAKGTNAFTLRQLSGKMNSNAVMVGAISFLLAFAVIGANVCMLQKVSQQAQLSATYPFDIYASYYADNNYPISFEDAEKSINKYASIKETIPFTTYDSGSGYLHSFTKWTGEGYSDLHDTVMPVSEYNKLLTALGKETISLNNQFLIAERLLLNADFSSVSLKLGGKSYSYLGIEKMPLYYGSYFIAVVPDEAITGLTVESYSKAYNLTDTKYDAMSLENDLSYSYILEGSDYNVERCDFMIKEMGRIKINTTSAIFIIGAMYIAVVFMFLAMAILALKVLSSLTSDVRKYGILYRLGADRKLQSKTLFSQIFSFFLLPFALPILLSIPSGIICSKMVMIMGFVGASVEMAVASIAISAIMLALYALYFSMTYLISKKKIVITELR